MLGNPEDRSPDPQDASKTLGWPHVRVTPALRGKQGDLKSQPGQNGEILFSEMEECFRDEENGPS